jgi:hypothetical protein
MAHGAGRRDGFAIGFSPRTNWQAFGGHAVFCTGCGKPVDDSDAFCPSCGKAQFSKRAPRKPRLTLKIAIGVFLGIICAFVVIEMPGWIRQEHKEHAQQVMLALTPAKVIARCGKPMGDTSYNLDEALGGVWTVEREIRDRGKPLLDHPQGAALLFDEDKIGNWTLRVFRVGIDVPLDTPFAALVWEKDAVEQVRVLPCVDAGET